MTNHEYPQMKYSEQKGLASIIVPIYNTNETYLRECLDSILSQTFTNWEAILVNDGSTDNTVKIIDEYAKKDSRFVAVHKQNQGTLLARKTGLENSKGEFILSIDSDDTHNPQFLEKMHLKIMETNSDFVWCKYQTECKYFDDCETYYNWNTEASENLEAMMTRHGLSWVTWNKLIRRKIYEKVRFPNFHITTGEDPIQTLQIAYNSKYAICVLENLYFHRDYGTSTSKQITKKFILSDIQAAIIINEIFETFFNGNMPYNLKNTFYSLIMKTTPYCFFSLSKKERQVFENKLKPSLPKFIKYEEKLSLRILLFLASKGVEFPFRFYQWIKLIKWMRNKKIAKKEAL